MQITTIMKKIVNMADIGYYAVPLHMINLKLINVLMTKTIKAIIKTTSG